MKTALLLNVLALILALLAWCGACTPSPSPPAPSPPSSSPAPPGPDGAALGPTQTAAAVLAEVQAAGCIVDGGLASLELEHASATRPPAIDCLFTPGSTVAACGCP
jgi:hypothetical protein